MDTERPLWLPHRAKDGIFETHFIDQERRRAARQDFRRFVERAIRWSDGAYADVDQASDTGAASPGARPNRYGVLDTYLGEAMTQSQLEQIIQRTTDDIPLQVLLVNPTSDFGRSRAEAMNNADPSVASRDSLETVLKAIRDGVGTRIQGFPTNADIATGDETTLAQWIHEFGPSAHLTLRFYSVAPSGPLYLLRDLALSGRFSFGERTTRLPWSMVVNDPACQRDHFDQCCGEFDRVWARGEQHPVDNQAIPQSGQYTVFLSHSSRDKQLAEELHHLLEEIDVETFLDSRDLAPGEVWPDELRDQLNAASELLVLITSNTRSSDWVNAEMGAFWAMGKPIVPATLVDEPEALPDFVKASQAVNVAHTEGKRNLVNAIAARAGRDLKTVPERP